MHYCYFESPIGPLLIAGDAEAIRHIGFPNEKRPRRPAPDWTESRQGVVAAAVAQLREYFMRRRTEFDLPLAPEGTTFQRRVWKNLQTIPYGETISYADLAKLSGNPKAARAVGSANGRNPIPIVIPCHRVIAADGRLGGFGGGLDVKESLLALESGGHRALPLR
jgi:methylated-DNA-[protein]-cysteine S-methyltransferase